MWKEIEEKTEEQSIVANRAVATVPLPKRKWSRKEGEN
jgi:hypothetical protein